MDSIILKPRKYQEKILNEVIRKSDTNTNILIELDCGLGKRYLQYSLINEQFAGKKILLILQASSSLYETYSYLKKLVNEDEISMIDNRIPSPMRSQILAKSRVVLCLPTTLMNTIRKNPSCADDFDLVIINEIDQIIRRLGSQSSLKQPYAKLFRIFKNSTIIGMSGTLRDNHYVVDTDQLHIRQELATLRKTMGNTFVISMDSIMDTDIQAYIQSTIIIPTSVTDPRLQNISSILDEKIESVKNEILRQIKAHNFGFYKKIKQDSTLLFGPLPVSSELLIKFKNGYLIRKYLWSMTGEQSKKHLYRFGLSREEINQLPMGPNKFLQLRRYLETHRKTVIICSYLSSVDLIQTLSTKWGFHTIKVTGQTTGLARTEEIEKFRATSKPAVAILSNVGERDLDLPEADQMIIFDLVRTTKTVYQKMKRTRGGICRLLFYEDTREEHKVKSVVTNILTRYNWSVQLAETSLSAKAQII